MCKIILNLYESNCITEFIVNLVTYGEIISQLHNKMNFICISMDFISKANLIKVIEVYYKVFIYTKSSNYFFSGITVIIGLAAACSSTLV